MKKMIVLIILVFLIIMGCEKKNEGDNYYVQGIKAEQNMQYETSISLFAKSLQFNREDAVTWYAKGRNHLLLAMQIALVDSVSDVQNVRILGNMSKATECFKRAHQWGFHSSAEVDSLQIWLGKKFFQ